MTHDMQSSTQSLDRSDQLIDAIQNGAVSTVEASNLQAVCETMMLHGRRRKLYINAANKLTNAAGAYARRICGFAADASEQDRDEIKKRAKSIVAALLKGKPVKEEDAEIALAIDLDMAVFRKSIAPIEIRREEIEREMKKLTRSLPVAEWADGVAGFGPLGLAVLIAESGNLSNYPHHKMLWKRLGLAPYEGKAYSTWRMNGGLTAEEWTDAGYKPPRRAEIHACIADPMSKHQLTSKEKSGTEYGGPKGPYGDVYIARRQATAIAHPDWKPAHARMDALRIMTKALVSDLWSEWRRSKCSMNPALELGAATSLERDWSDPKVTVQPALGPSPSNPPVWE
jgi:hypothetical protein